MAVVAPTALPEPTLPTNRTNGTVTYDDHALNHNAVNDAINQSILALNSHFSDGNPHTQYLLATSGDLRYLQLTGGSVLTGLLGPTTTNTLDLGTTALRWRKLWAVDGEFTNPPTVGGVALPTATHAHDTRYPQLTGGSVMTGQLGPSTNNANDLGTAALRWKKLWGYEVEVATSLSIGNPDTTLTRLGAATAGINAALTPTTSNARALGGATNQWASGHFAFLVLSGDGTGSGFPTTGALRLRNNQSISWRNAADTADYTLVVTASNYLVTSAHLIASSNNTLDLGLTGTRWRKLWATDGEFTNAPTVGGVALPTFTTADARYQQSGQKGAASGYAPLDANSLIPTTHLPPLAITNTFVAANQAAMLALTAQTGDVCVRTDTSTTYILAAEPASTLGNWTLLATPPDAVLSVNGETGVVLLDAADVGAATPASVTAAITTHEGATNPHATYATDAEVAALQARVAALEGTAPVDAALRTYVQTIMAVLDPGGPPPPTP